MIANATLRKATPEDAKDIARVHLAVQQHAYQEIFPLEHLVANNFSAVVSDKREKLRSDQAGQTITFLAENNTREIVAYASGGPRRDGPEMYSGELYNIFVLPQYQDQGIGSNLFLSVIEFLMAQGKDALLLWVIQNTAATNYYRHLQGKIIAERNVTAVIPFMLECYGWSNLVKLRDILSLSQKTTHGKI